MVISAPLRAGELQRDLSAPSAALAREIPYAVYLPDGYAQGDGRYPVLFLLHGLGGGVADWLDAGRLGPTLDRLIAAGAVPPMIVVVPGLGDGWYVDNPDPGGFGATQAAFLGDLVPFVDRTWRTIGHPDGRAVAGLSMGGWGAMRFAMLQPGRFAAAASLSGAIVPESWAATPSWAELLASGFGRPVDLARFRAASPLGMVPAFARASPRPALFLTCGTGDELGLAEANRVFHRALQDAGVAAELRLTDGGHDWDLWSRELEPVLRFVGAHVRAR